MLVSISRPPPPPPPPKKTLKKLFWWTFISANPPPTSSTLCPSPSSPSSCLTLGFWLSPDQTPVNNPGQVTPSRLAFTVFFFRLFLLLFVLFFLLFSPHFVSACIPCTLSLCWKTKWFGSDWDVGLKMAADFQCTAMQQSFSASWLFKSLLSSVRVLCFDFTRHVHVSCVFPYLESELVEPYTLTTSRSEI